MRSISNLHHPDYHFVVLLSFSFEAENCLYMFIMRFPTELRPENISLFPAQDCSSPGTLEVVPVELIGLACATEMEYHAANESQRVVLRKVSGVI